MQKLERREGENGIQITMHVLFGISKSMLQLVLMTVIFDCTFTETLHICRFKMLSFVSQCSGICVIKHIKGEYKNFRFKNVLSVNALNVLQMRGCTLHCPHPWNTQDTTGQCQFCMHHHHVALFSNFRKHTHSCTHVTHARTHTHMACTHTRTHARVQAHTRVRTHTHPVHSDTHLPKHGERLVAIFCADCIQPEYSLLHMDLHTSSQFSYTICFVFVFLCLVFFPFSLNATDFTSHMPPCSSQLAQCSIPHIPSQCSKTMYTYQKGKRRFGACSIPPSSLHPPKHIFIIKVSCKQYCYL